MAMIQSHMRKFLFEHFRNFIFKLKTVLRINDNILSIVINVVTKQNSKAFGNHSKTFRRIDES